jgi:hypothetical protein
MRSIRGSLAKCTADNRPVADRDADSTAQVTPPSTAPMATPSVTSGRLVLRYRACGRRLSDVLSTAISEEEMTLAQHASALLLVTEKLIWLVQNSLTHAHIEQQPASMI